MKIRLAAELQEDSIVDGLGIRTVIWTQGCSHNCPFCHNPETHDFNGGKEFFVEDIAKKLKKLKGQDGITLSGGDPMFQPKACSYLANIVHSLGMNVWVYTGFTFEELIKSNNDNIKEFLNNIDVLVDGKFDIKLKSMDIPFRGSSNQRLIDVPKSLASKSIVLLDLANTTNSLKKEKLYI